MAKQKYDYDLIVIGSGAGGSVTADIAAQAGKRVAMIENDTLGGECPNWGCVPTKALLHAANIYDAAKNAQRFGIRAAAVGYNYPTIKAWKDLAIKRTGAANSEKYYQSQGITLFRGAAHFISPHEITVNRRHLSAANFLVATGSHWNIPDIEGLDTVPYLTARTAIDLVRPPKSLFIIGGGSVGCEFTELFSTFGSKVFIADVAPRLLSKEDSEVSEVIERQFHDERGVQILTKTKVIRVAKEGVIIRVTYLRGGEEHTVKVDQLMIASGKLPTTDLGLENAGIEYSGKGIDVDDYLQTTAKHIFAAGDVLGRYMFTHMGVYEGRIVANNLLHRNKIAPDYKAVPRVTFTTPEVASVGMTESDCLRHDLAINKGLAPLNIIGRSNANDMREGFAKVIVDKKGVLIGATVVAPHAGEIIHELTLAIQHGMTAADISNTLHAFPTWSEVVRVACAKVTS
ncbi:NAD(P)/FAD-dependent oxidoreductase [Pedobacter sp.]|nr:NAD(P)/FAD-dependent oxidoreductase [Candidatus Saccharibacteria bacterium]